MKYKIKLHKITFEEKLFFFMYGIYLIKEILCTSFYARYIPHFISSGIDWLFVILLLIIEGSKVKLEKKQFGFAILFAVMCVSIYLITRDKTVAIMLLLVFCARKISFEQIARISVWIIMITCAFIVVSSYVGLIPNYISYGIREREYMGFLYSLYLPAYMFNVTLLLIYLYKKNITITIITVLSFINWLIYWRTDSRLSFYLSMLALIVALFMKYNLKWIAKKKFIWKICVSSFFMGMGSSLLIIYEYARGSNWVYRLDSIFGGRIRLGYLAIIKYGISLWGQKIIWVGNGLDRYGQKSTLEYNYVDSFYIQVLQHYGVIFTIIWLLLLTITAWRCYKKNDYYLLVALAFIALHCLVDDLNLRIRYNTFWFVIGSVLIQGANNGIKKVRMLSQDAKNNSEGIP